MNILVTNDDGITAPGLLSLARAMRDIGQVTVLAPDRNWSGSGHVKTLNRPLRVNKVKLADGTNALASDGAPSDCVALAILGIVSGDIDIVVSGINPLPNIGHDVTYSGTVTAAMEAVIWGVPGVAISLDSEKNHLSKLDYSTAGWVAQKIVTAVKDHGIPSGILLNVNVPNLSIEQIKGFRATRQGMRVYRDRLDERFDPRGEPYYWIGGDSPSRLKEDGTDVGALAEGFVSITPLQLDLTAYVAMQGLKRWPLNNELTMKSKSNGRS
jgi:5'-nucleotidase